MTAIHDPARRAPTSNAPPGQPPERQPASDERTLREERLLDAAATLLVRYGYRKTTIDDVAREAGVGKGTIYLHWKDKNALFRAAIWREQQRFNAELQRRIAADPEGGLLHRITIHGMLAAMSNPLIAAIVGGRSDIVGGFFGAMDAGSLQQLMGSGDAYIRQLQDAGLIRADLPASVVTYLLGALKMGMFNSPELHGREQLPTTEQLAEAFSDLIRRWLEPERPPQTSDLGKQLLARYFASVKEPE
jgi:AcrR family transcriptional regulator